MNAENVYDKLEITVQQLSQMREKKVPHTLLDVREPWEVEVSHLDPYLNVPLEDLVEKVGKIPHNHPVVILCHHGVRSLRACCWLKKLGFTRVTSLRGGIDAWSQEIDSEVPRYIRNKYAQNVSS